MPQKKKFYITTPIYYASGRPHIGHSYTTVLADALARWQRFKGADVMFLTGLDEHGEKVEEKARLAGVEPQEYVDRINEDYVEVWKKLDISYDRYIRTTGADHMRRVQAIFQRLVDSGDIYPGSYEGLYCTPCEAYWLPSQLDEDGNCPDCHRELRRMSEPSYFFRLSKYQKPLEELFAREEPFLVPAGSAREMINNFLKPGLQDLAVTRSAFDWGVVAPNDSKFVIYVWIDALLNYITAMGYPDNTADMERYWPADIQLVGREIVRFHTLIWPAFLMALDLPVPKKVYAHGWLLFDNVKMSKSLGNVVDPLVLAERYGVDSIRYYLLSEMGYGVDGSYTNSDFLQRINTDLVNNLGNLLSRTTAMINKYFDGVLPYVSNVECSSEESEWDLDLRNAGESLFHQVDTAMAEPRAANALDHIFTFAARCNKYIDLTEPWVLGRDAAHRDRLAVVLRNLSDGLRIIAALLQAFLPRTAAAMAEALGLSAAPEQLTWEQVQVWGVWQPTEKIAGGVHLFSRLDVDAEIEALNKIYSEQ
ncbi:MAG: methionine--tRNA ligase [Clostridiaceae bacterium]|nr:methionine--tRNA ligase [Clostridiaceae bacterium]